MAPNQMGEIMNRCTCSLENGIHDPDCQPARDVAFAELHIAVLDAEKELLADSNDENIEKYLLVSREYRRVLRERLDAARAREIDNEN